MLTLLTSPNSGKLRLTSANFDGGAQCDGRLSRSSPVAKIIRRLAGEADAQHGRSGGSSRSIGGPPRGRLGAGGGVNIIPGVFASASVARRFWAFWRRDDISGLAQI